MKPRTGLILKRWNKGTIIAAAVSMMTGSLNAAMSIAPAMIIVLHVIVESIKLNGVRSYSFQTENILMFV
jgi:hypothetical protein